ncbi:ubiquinol-cytochrome c reductase iron-sulfur subunit [Streptomyces sp. NBC_01264]|uniref:QcrA and Rieske domain-containing protein n=1 Tax=Streptomyces sp. NBC_01264 TaxID=2903804 RepID=UPI002250E2EF|nr:Rieske (2Fe-2S) protein [Streptomyces sp. NBC_01264]MCX4775604.1 Rieske (2Fe-2S) protein [Streptomyces sp. NBC_01264]
MYRPLALLLAFYLCVAGVCAVATTPWSGGAGPAPSSAAALVTPGPPTRSGAAPSTTSPSTAPTVPAVWTRSTLRNYLVAEAIEKDPGVALADLERITVKSPYANAFCHPIAHDLGRSALTKYHGDFTKAVNFLNDVCGSGYLHGVVEEKLQEMPNPVTAVTTLCGPEQTRSCIHGVGHGTMFVSHLDVAAAEKMCDRFPKAYQVTACSEGIFMQLFEPDEGDPTALAKLPVDKLADEPLGNDLIYLVAWLPLMLVGTPHLSLDALTARRGRPTAGAAGARLHVRRHLLLDGAIATLAVAGATLLTGAAAARSRPRTSAAPTDAPAPAPAPSASAGPSGPGFAAASVPVGGALRVSAPGSGDPVYVQQPKPGEYTALSGLCTHSGCTVNPPKDGRFLCPCHNSSFDAATGAVLQGPATQALARFGITRTGDQLRLQPGEDPTD